jgi:hypothetical protein
MKKIAAALLLATALATPSLAFAKDLTISAQIASYRGPNTYLAIYVTKADGTYVSTLWVAGTRTRYLGHLRDWARGISATADTIDGISGASVGSGQTLTINASLADAMIDAGYEIRVDDSVEDGGDYSSDVAIPLTAANSGVAFPGSGYVSTLTVNM